MPTQPLTLAEASALKDQVAAHLRWLTEVCERLKHRGYGPNDLLGREAIGARDKMQDLHVAAHYESCTGGVAKD